jgi:hypothetical protein
MRYKGAVLSATAPVTSIFSAQGGMYTMRQQLQAVGGTGWPDAFFTWVIKQSDAKYTTVSEIVTDSLDNNYIIGSYTLNDGGTDNTKALVTKVNRHGNLEWQYGYTATNKVFYANNITISSSGNVYILGVESSSQRVFIIKLSSLGVEQWQMYLWPSTGAGSGFWTGKIFLNSNEDIYCIYTGYQPGFSTAASYITKLSSAGSILWSQKRLFSSAVNNQGRTGGLLSNQYIVMLSDTGGSSGQVLKYAPTGGAPISEYSFTDSSGTFTPTALVIDSLDNLYVTNNCRLSAYNGTTLVKMNSAATISWARRLYYSADSSASTIPVGVVIGQDGYIYVAYYVRNNASTYYFSGIAKYNSSGAIQWNRTFASNATLSSSFLHFKGMSISSNGYLEIPFEHDVSGVTSWGVLKLATTMPVGNYGSFIYADATGFTEGARTVTRTTSTQTNSAATFTSIAPSFTQSPVSLTYSKTTI